MIMDDAYVLSNFGVFIVFCMITFLFFIFLFFTITCLADLKSCFFICPGLVLCNVVGTVFLGSCSVGAFMTNKDAILYFCDLLLRW